MISAIWTEKYRPKSFSDIKGQTEILRRIRAFVKEKNMPHVLFSGPAGVGKTSLAMVIARELFSDQWTLNFLELNASDERGIDVVRNKVKDFARTRAIGDAPFKIIYLDESDALTKEAQQALRRTMENYTKTCRFILACNYSSKIIEPIQSRCAVFRFRPLSDSELLELVDVLVAGEELKIDDEARRTLIEISNGDCRRLENLLQSCAVISKHITQEALHSIASIARPKELKRIMEFAIGGDFIKARDELLSTMLKYGVSGLDFVKQIQKEVWGLSIPDQNKLKLVDACGETEFRMVEGADEFVQLEALLAKFACLAK
jgi:replication factor C small subunit